MVHSHDQDKWSTFTKGEFPLKPFGDHDIDVAIDGQSHARPLLLGLPLTVPFLSVWGMWQ